MGHEFKEYHQPPPDRGTVVRQWIGLFVASGGLFALVTLSFGMGQVDEKVTSNGVAAREARAAALHLEENLAEHMKDANQGFKDIAQIASDLNARVSKVEGSVETHQGVNGPHRGRER